MKNIGNGVDQVGRNKLLALMRKTLTAVPLTRLTEE